MKPLIASLALILSSTLNAQIAPDTDGFSGDLFFGPVVLNTSSNTDSVNDDNALVDDLNQQPDAINRVVPGALGNVYYTFDDAQQQVYVGLGMSRVIKGNFAPEVGYRYFTGEYQSFTVAYVPDLIPYDTWSDPYLTGEERTKTERNVSGFRFRADALWGPLSLEGGLGQIDISDDEAGASLNLTSDERDLLKRSGDLKYLAIDLQFPIARGVILRPGIYSYSQNVDGNANDFQTYGAEIGIIARRGKHTLIANVAYEDYHFNQIDPIFGTHREFDEWRLFGTYFYKEPFALKDFSLVLLAVLKDKSSNIDFYAEEAAVVGAGLKYDF